MKKPSIWNFRPIVGKVMTGLALAVMIGSIHVVPSFGEDGHGRYERGERGHNRDRYEHNGREYNRDRYYYKHGRRYYRQPVYRERVYIAPPPVIYAPPEPPGISFFFPPIIIR
ncbi:MAG: hypothetical protein M0T70_00470 [Geobacteraceae bacterium]|nr:hypothetical protein [Geobacteraceae bacterium]